MARTNHPRPARDLSRRACLTLPLLGPKAGDRFDLPVRSKRKDIRTSPALLIVRGQCDPLDEHQALALADVASTLHAKPWHETLHGTDLFVEIVDADDHAEAILEADGRCRNRGEPFTTLPAVRLDPGGEPLINGTSSVPWRSFATMLRNSEN